MSNGPKGWVASAMGIALMVLATCFALKLAAGYLLAALPVLVPVVVLIGISIVAWRWWSGRPRGW